MNTNTSQSQIGSRERETQDKVISLFREKLGYEYLGNWDVTEFEAARKSPIEENILQAWLLGQRYDRPIVAKAIEELNRARSCSNELTDNNYAAYEKLYYGAKISMGAGKNNITVKYIDWDHPERNRFGVAEEVSVQRVITGTRRPDVVLYVNGIAVGTLELKKATVSVAEGIRQNLTNQSRREIPHFFSTVQLVMAGNETQGLRYGTVGTPEKYYLKWKRSPEDTCDAHLLEHLEALCNKETLLDFIHNFIIFDSKIKKVARQNQYYAIKAAQLRVQKREGGIIWHTQGSGKSLMMVLLAKWILENNSDARILIITDRIELDEQIVRVFSNSNYKPFHARNAGELLRQLNGSTLRTKAQASDDVHPSIICSLLHKFRGKNDYDEFIRQLRSYHIDNFSVKGELFVFVDECHRSESGQMKKAMDGVLGRTQMYVGFTGTPLLKRDKATSQQIFGTFIHTYKFDEAVRDGVVLDLRYEARNIENRVVSQDRLDMWFERIANGMTDEAKRQVKQKWGTVSSVFSSKERLENIAADICLDFVTRPRLYSDHGNAMLVAGSIYEAYRYYSIFRERVEMKKKCAVIASFEPDKGVIRTEGSDARQTEDRFKYDVCRQMITDFDMDLDGADAIATFENKMKKLFIKKPSCIKLLIVVDKLLTGFDAPPATYLYIDKKMRDHGLFQAVCRVNRLDGESKEYGYIVDYRQLFPKLEEAYRDFTSDAFDAYDKEDIDGLLKDRLQEAKKRLEECIEKLDTLCEPVPEPKGRDDYLRYFCHGENLKRHALQRSTLYKWTASLIRAYAQIKNEMVEAGYTDDRITRIKNKVSHYTDVRMEVRLASGDHVDMKSVEAEMRQLVGDFVKADHSAVLTTLGDRTLSELLTVNAKGILEELNERVGKKNAAEAIYNNLKHDITEKSCLNPKYYDKLSRLLDEIVKQLKEDAISYAEFLKQIEQLAMDINYFSKGNYPSGVNTPRQKALYDNAPEKMSEAERERFAIELDLCLAKNAEPGFDMYPTRAKSLMKAIKQTLQAFKNTWKPEELDRVADNVYNLAKNHGN